MTIASDFKDKLKLMYKKVKPGSSSRKKVIVIGSHYNVGKATLMALAAIHDDSVKPYAGTDDKVKNPVELDGVETIETNLSDKAALTESLEGYDAAYIAVPNTLDGTQLTINGIEAAKQAGVKFLLLFSVISLNSDESTFEKEFQPIRVAAEESDIDYAVVRLPLEEETPVVVGDVGKLSANILAEHHKHSGKEYKLETAH